MTRLNVEGEVKDVDGAGGAEDGGWYPQNISIVRDDGHSIPVFFESSVRTVVNTQPLTV